MTSLWFEHLTADDRVSVKPHASPVLHAINYLLGHLDPQYLTRLRDFGGLQSYPSRTKDPDPVDFSTGSVGLGATAPIWAALARRYVDSRTGLGSGGRHYALLGDAELDEGACWEAILDPAVAELGEVVWIVDANRQSLDRVVPHLAIDRLQGMFAAAGWQVLNVKYGHLLEDLFNQPGGQALRTRIDRMPNPEYQRLLRCAAADLRERLPGPTTEAAGSIRELLSTIDDRTLNAAIRNLGGHDHTSLGAAFRSIDDTRPTWILEQLFPSTTSMVTVLDGHPHTLAFLSGASRSPAIHLGVTRFGQSGTLPSVYRHHDINADSIIKAVLDLREHTNGRAS